MKYNFKGNWGRILLTFFIVASTVISVIVDWNDTHVFSHHWPGDARYHGLLFLNLLCGTSILGLWCMWRKSQEPELGVRIAVIITLIYRVSFFYLSFLPPMTSLLPESEHAPHINGIPIYLNVVASGMFILFILFSYWIYRREHRKDLEFDKLNP